MTLLLLLRPSFGATAVVPDNPSMGGGNPNQLLSDPFSDPFAADPFANPFRRDPFLPQRRKK